MSYTLAFIMCISGSPDAECRATWMDLPDLRTCAAMKRLVIQEARDEGFTVQAVCTPLETESRATSLSNIPRQ
jgi:hypothetical protein